jgi:ABC-2 type transport system permease protein
MKTMNIISRIIRQTVNDKRSLGLILLVPIFIFTLLFFLLGDSDYHANIAVNGLSDKLVQAIEDQEVTVTSMTIEEAKAQLEEKEKDALLYMDGTEIVLLLDSNDAVKAGGIKKALTNAMKTLNPKGTMRVELMYGDSDANMFNSLGYVLMGVISFFLIFIIAGISFVRERTNQTMERLMVTPVKRWQVILGYTLGFGIFAVLQSIILLLYLKWVLNMSISGSIVSAGMIMILLSMAAVCIGAFCSIFANNEFQIMQFIPVVVIPQIFFSGLISLDTFPYHLGELARIMPVYYACDALYAITIKGDGLIGVGADLLALFIFILIFFIINIFALKKYRRI